MSESNNGRPRRRAARSAGPPVEDGQVVDVTVDAGAVESAEVADAEEATVVAVPVELTKAAVVDEADDDSAELDEEDAKLTRLGQIIGLAAAAVLVLALVVGAGFAAFAARSGSQDEDLRAQYTQTARQAVINLTTIRADSAKEDIDRILSVASGEFKNEFDGRVDPFMDVVKQAKVVSTGEVVESGIESVDENSAKVLVAAKQMVSNTGSAEPQARQYRFRITVSKGDSGMTVSKVEFVG
ncbi:hypothetical protein [Nocardia salmonicida]|uniref:hypothetical protein n=1 Tax=Nocardia salmonicida TaxID=53431 RepID=UPI002E27B711|nr:hypothetical protein [Nocardia salmonicida]